MSDLLRLIIKLNFMLSYASFVIQKFVKMSTSSEKACSGKKKELSFSSLNLGQELLKNLLTLNYDHMTAIQAESLPLMLRKIDIIAQAQTGSGKTVAFGLAILNQLNIKSAFTQSLVLCPTRELAEQVTQVIRRLARLLPNIKVLNLSGGSPIRPQYESLRHGAHIIVGTPGRPEKRLTYFFHQVNSWGE